MAKAEQRSPFARAPLQSLQRYYGLLRPCAPRRYSRPRGWCRLWLLPSRCWRDGAQVLTFRTKAWSSFAPPTCRMPLGPYQGISRADPGGRVIPRFWHRLIRFRHFCDGSLALASLDRACRNLVPAFPQRSPPRLLAAAACGGLRSAPDHRTSKGPPSSLVQLRTADTHDGARDTRPNRTFLCSYLLDAQHIELAPFWSPKVWYKAGPSLIVPTSRQECCTSAPGSSDFAHRRFAIHVPNPSRTISATGGSPCWRD